VKLYNFLCTPWGINVYRIDENRTILVKMIDKENMEVYTYSKVSKDLCLAKARHGNRAAICGLLLLLLR